MILKLSMMTPESMLKISSGEVTVPETLDFRYKPPKPEPGGLHCEKVFGPVNNFECSCRSLIGRRHRGTVCMRCGVEVGLSIVRYQRMGHINLPIPVIHPLATKGISRLFDFSPRIIKELRDCVKLIRVDNHPNGIFVVNDKKISLTLVPFEDSSIPEDETNKSVLMSLSELIDAIDFKKSAEDNPQVAAIIKNINPKLYILKRILVSPAGHRPVIELEGGFWVNHDHNEHYRRVIRKKLRIEALKDYPTPKIIFFNEQAILQRAINDLFINGVVDHRGHYLKSLLDNLKGKPGLSRSSLLGKRVDYSGRSVITVGPDLKSDEAGLPVKMAYELFKPFILHKLLENKYCESFKEAKNAYSAKDEICYTYLEEIVSKHRIILNRQPTLHRYGVQSFKIKLTEKKALQLTPLVCYGYNADFDGDQMACYIPLSDKALQDSKKMDPSNNLLSSLNSTPIISPNHEMLIGAFYMTNLVPSVNKTVISNYEEGEYLLQAGYINIGTTIILNKKETCMGRLMLGKIFGNEINFALDKKTINGFLSKYFDNNYPKKMIRMLDEAKTIMLEYATKSGMSVCIKDIKPPINREKKFKEAEDYCKQLVGNSNEELVRKWYNTFKELEQEMVEQTSLTNPVMVMLKTGARAKMTQVSQLTIGKMITDSKGEIIPVPIKHGYGDGLSMLEWFITIYGSRKSMADKKEVTPKAGYLARRLVTAARDLYVSEEDCGSTDGILMKINRAYGRITLDGKMVEKSNSTDLIKVRSVVTCKGKGGVCQQCYGMDPATRELVEIGNPCGVIACQCLTEPATQMTMRTFHTSGVAEIKSSPLTVNATLKGKIKSINEMNYGYIEIEIGSDNDSRKYIVNKEFSTLLIKLDEEVDIGTPLVIYNRHLIQEDIKGTLSKLEVYFESRSPKSIGIVSISDGIVKLKYIKNKIGIFVNDKLQGSTIIEPIYVGSGDHVTAGQTLSHGDLNIGDIFKRGGIGIAAQVFIDRVSVLYETEGISPLGIHPEMIFRSMTELTRESNGDIGLRREKGTGTILICGITEVGKKYPSWLKNIGFGWVKDSLERASIKPIRTMNLPSERIMTGELLGL